MAEPARQFENDEVAGNQPSSPQYGAEQLREAERASVGQPPELNSSSTAAGNVRYSSEQPEASTPSFYSSSTSGGDKESYSSSEAPPSEGSLYNSSHTQPKKGKVRLSTFFRTRRGKAIIGGGTVGGGIVALFFGFSVFQGPLQFIHMAQLLQQFHFRSNEDFGDGRGSKILLYALGGKGAERGRLGALGNYAADKWEERLVREQGLRPIYTSGTGRAAGYEIIDHKKAKAHIEEWQRNGGEIRKVRDSAKTGQQVVGSNKDRTQRRLDPDSDFIDARAAKPKAKRALVTSVGRATKTYKIVVAGGSRLLKIRGGIDFHPLKNVKRKATDKLADYRSKARAKKAEADRSGTSTGDLGTKTGEDGEPASTPEDTATTDETKKVIEEAQQTPGRETIKGILNRIGRGSILFGIFCSVKSFGDDVEQYKYTNNYLPEMRMGMSAITMGNQVMTGNDVNLDELGAFNENFYDESSKTSWVQAKSIQAEQGQPQTGPDVPAEAKLNNINDQPFLFDIINAIPGLSASCSVVNGFLHSIPVLNNVSDAGSKVIIGGVDVVAKQFGTSVEEISEGALAAVSGQSVNTLAQGAEFGNLANVGAFSAANDQAISMGGAPLEPNEVAQLKSEEKLADKDNNVSKSLAQRLNPKDPDSVIGKISLSAPHSFAELASMFRTPFKFIGNAFSSLMPRASAAEKPYDYGVPKYGFSVAEQEDPAFEDPYENSTIIEDEAHGGKLLSDLNEKYGKKCFGMSLTATDSGVSIQSDEAVNVFKVSKDDSCNPKKNKDPLFLRYRFYIADAVSANSLACYEGRDEACTNIGFDEGEAESADSGDESSPAVSGDAQELAKKILTDDSIDLSCYSSSVPQDVQNAANGKPGTAGTMTSSAVLQLIASVGKKHRVCVTAIQSNGGGHSANSLHYRGDAVDFGNLDGKMLTGRDSGSVAIIRIAEGVLPKGSGFGQTQDPKTGASCGPQISLVSGFTQFPDFCNHLHVQVPAGTP